MLEIATVCASNNNRSMSAHKALRDAGYSVNSYGTGSAVRLPGPRIDKPNNYSFGTPYEQIYNELKAQDERLYRANGLLTMIDRNRQLKTAPERWHDGKLKFDIVITCEERCFDSVCEDMLNRAIQPTAVSKPVHIINVEIKDNAEEAAKGAAAILDLVKTFEAAGDDLDDRIADLVAEWQEKYPKLPILLSSHYY
ncbi:RNA polymerase II subunit A C-terminal domain phosphatase [Savitreella phatthalungensis]